MGAITFHVDAVLFDMDGTLVDSTAGVIGAWETFAETYPGLDVQKILSSSHGVRTVDNLKKYCGITSSVELEKEAARFEEAIVTSSKANGRNGITLLSGVRSIMDELVPGKNNPKPCWAIVTSATRAYASAALEISGIPVPDAFVTAEDVTQGKPYPDPYLLGAYKCGVPPGNCLVVEDAPSGVASGLAAGCAVIGLITSHTKEQMEAKHPTYLVENLSSVSMKMGANGGVDVVVNID
ncbi:HAD-like domain-containing protein [Suillus clintonianus]|uniref:HAD-like domain-containing protein n=1 Tax=Suillus clintonianus TaxID=1904413 RepID=UPI001B85C778|nr:HAD-like domain-containing protein [Suillus clintonianus]KAG2156233.1 HAD-like domain-containing protein [Suillus clintonianus]